MKNLNQLIILSLFSSLLFGCGLKGPLYRTTTTEDKVPVVEQEQSTSKPSKEVLLDDIQTKLQEDADETSTTSDTEN